MLSIDELDQNFASKTCVKILLKSIEAFGRYDGHHTFTHSNEHYLFAIIQIGRGYRWLCSHIPLIIITDGSHYDYVPSCGFQRGDPVSTRRLGGCQPGCIPTINPNLFVFIQTYRYIKPTSQAYEYNHHNNNFNTQMF